jgi:hypothetical protein
VQVGVQVCKVQQPPDDWLGAGDDEFMAASCQAFMRPDQDRKTGAVGEVKPGQVYLWISVQEAQNPLMATIVHKPLELWICSSPSSVSAGYSDDVIHKPQRALGNLAPRPAAWCK